MAGNRLHGPDEIMQALEDNGLRLRGERVAILQDEGKETYIDGGLIARPETHEDMPLAGTIVALGSGVSDEDQDLYGAHVHFNRFSVITFTLTLDGLDQTIALHVMHVSDIYWEG
jgi:co-chaperonin GroES (HSP10)